MFPKRYLASKSIHGNRRYLQLNIKNARNRMKKQYGFQSISRLFYNQLKISAVSVDGFWCKIDFWKAISFRLYDWKYTTKFFELHYQIWLQIWNLLKIGRILEISYVFYVYVTSLLFRTFPCQNCQIFSIKGLSTLMFFHSRLNRQKENKLSKIQHSLVRLINFILYLKNWIIIS